MSTKRAHGNGNDAAVDHLHDSGESPAKLVAVAKENIGGPNGSSQSSSSARRAAAATSGGLPAAKAGIIKEIYMENFMCHQKYRVQLNRNITFIHGQNGSGKSAILAAIQICLGAGARRTHRARNLGELVRHGATQALIRVQLHNAAPEGYLTDLYGETITVERSISLKGSAAGGSSNGYKLLDVDGKAVSRSKKDLEEMLDVLNIQVENPVAVLDQEQAKKFLLGKDEDKYQFFLKATELERIDRSFASAVDQIENLQAAQERKKDHLEGLLHEADKLKRIWDEHQKIGKLQEKLEETRVKYTWSYFQETDKAYQDAAESMETCVARAEKRQRELTQAEEHASDNGSEGHSKSQKIKDLTEEASQQADIKRQLEAQLKQVLVPQKATERHLEQLVRHKKQKEKELDLAKKRLQDARDEIIAQAGSAESEEARRAAELRQTEEEMAAARAKVNGFKQATAEVLRSYEELEPHVRDAKANVDRVKRQCHAVDGTIRDLESSTSGSLTIFGPRVAKVAKMVEEAKRLRIFRGPVVGPIGAFLNVAPGKEAFAPLAELALGANTLDRFIVTEDQDRQALQKIRIDAGCTMDCGIFKLHNGPRYQIPSPPQDDGIETVASALSVNDDLVFNCLVDNARIDQRALARDQKLSEDCLMLKNDRGDLSIRGNIKDVFFLPDGDQWTVKKGSYSVFSNEKKFRKTIGVDKTKALDQARRELAQLERDLSEMEKAKARLENEHISFQRDWNKAKRAMAANDGKIEELTERIDAIKDQMGAATNVELDTSEFEAEVSHVEQELEALSQTIEETKVQVDNAAPEVDQVREKLDNTRTRNEKILDELRQAQEELTQYLDTQSQHADVIEKKRKKVEEFKELIARHKEQVDSYAFDRESALYKAKKLHYRFFKKHEDNDAVEGSLESQSQQDPTPEDLESIECLEGLKQPAYYEKKIEAAKSKIDEERARRKVNNEDPVVAFENYSRAKANLESKKKSIDETEDKIEVLQNDVLARQKRWRHMRKHLAQATSMKFDEMLTQNNYTGSLHFDTDEGKLQIEVQKESNAGVVESKDVKGLSGGERSHTTICLLLALGEQLDTPFRVLDEFDVFLDAQVRKLVIEALISDAKRLSHRQFIFITPQDLSSLRPDPQLSILKISPPERYNKAGAPLQQTLDFA